jgi:hypothetical protein
MEIVGNDRGGGLSTFHRIGERVFVIRDAGSLPAEAEIVNHNFHRPHLVSVAYLRSRTVEWILRSRITGRAGSREV